jgi:hypothetical protein
MFQVPGITLFFTDAEKIYLRDKKIQEGKRGLRKYLRYSSPRIGTGPGTGTITS